jgi:site-specific DNA recombinase
MAGKGIGTKEIAKALNQEGLLTSTGLRWTKTYVHKILNNEAYCGVLVLGGRPGHKAVHSGEPPVKVENAWPAIIDKESYYLVRQKIAANAPEAVHPRIVPSFYLLSGLLFCSCGRAMIGRSAKSHRYYYYVCNKIYKRGKDACDAVSLPKEKLENLVIEIIKSKILAESEIEKLVFLANEELKSANLIYHEKLNDIDLELGNVNARLDKLYDVLETGKLGLDELAPRIKQLKTRQDELSKARVMMEAEMATQGVEPLSVAKVKGYVHDLMALLTETDIIRSKSFLRSFIDKIVIQGTGGKINYKLPVPPKWQEHIEFSALPIEPPSGAGGIRTPYLRDANATFSRVNYGPVTT